MAASWVETRKSPLWPHSHDGECALWRTNLDTWHPSWGLIAVAADLDRTVRPFISICRHQDSRDRGVCLDRRLTTSGCWTVKLHGDSLALSSVTVMSLFPESTLIGEILPELFSRTTMVPVESSSTLFPVGIRATVILATARADFSG